MIDKLCFFKKKTCFDLPSVVSSLFSYALYLATFFLSRGQRNKKDQYKILSHLFYHLCKKNGTKHYFKWPLLMLDSVCQCRFHVKQHINIYSERGTGHYYLSIKKKLISNGKDPWIPLESSARHILDVTGHTSYLPNELTGDLWAQPISPSCYYGDKIMGGPHVCLHQIVVWMGLTGRNEWRMLGMYVKSI